MAKGIRTKAVGLGFYDFTRGGYSDCGGQMVKSENGQMVKGRQAALGGSSGSWSAG
jgi:hypothetical protein